MDVRLTSTDCDKAGDYAVPNVLSPRALSLDLTTCTKLYYIHTYPTTLLLTIKANRWSISIGCECIEVPK